MTAWVLWLILAVLLGVAEAFTLTAVLGLLGGAALITAGVAALGLPPAVQLLVFALASTAGVLVVRPIAQRQARRGQLVAFGVDAVVGRPGFAVTDVTARSGTVRIDGEQWTARALDADLVIPAGAAVHVMQIDGATAVVYPQE
jgi:membrane protein implicated in regulation of membrane protease activity